MRTQAQVNAYCDSIWYEGITLSQMNAALLAYGATQEQASVAEASHYFAHD